MAGILFLSVGGRSAAASTASFDSISVSSVGALGDNGITISSSVYIRNGNSLTLDGATGYITLVSSVNASAFFADGSHLNGVASLVATQTFSGGNTFISSFTVDTGGMAISLSTSASTNNLLIGSNGTASFYPELHNSSSTTVPQAATTALTCSICVAGSTLTITTAGGNVGAVLTGYIDNSAGTAELGLLQDGQYVGNFTSQVSVRADATPFFSNTIFKYLVTGPDAGTHSYCLTLCRTTAVGTATLYNDSANANIFFVEELR